jgi:hypothetical protein
MDNNRVFKYMQSSIFGITKLHVFIVFYLWATWNKTLNEELIIKKTI